MDPFRPQLGDLPQEFAVFPLTGALLLPNGKLPLNIFEPRYVAMTLDSLAAGRMFGMIQPDPTASPAESGTRLYRVGCLGRLSSFSETDDGRLLITLTGLIRFTVQSELALRRGYRRIVPRYAGFEADLASGNPTRIDRDAILTALRGYFTRRGVEANWDAIKRMSDDVLVVTLAMACPFEAVEKQALLEAPTEADRADTLLALLQMGAMGPEGSSGLSVS
jgi:uncharacterized protein